MTLSFILLNFIDTSKHVYNREKREPALKSIKAGWQSIHVVRDQLESLADDVQKVRTHPLISDSVLVGGFIYDVDTGLLDQRF